MMADEITALRAEISCLREALKRSMTALDDWLNIYAEDFCDEKRVKEAKDRVFKWGWLAYVADVQEQNRAALTTAQKDTQC